MKVHHITCNTLDMDNSPCYVVKIQLLVVGSLFVFMQKGKLIGDTDCLRGPLDGSRPPHSGRTHLSHHRNIAPGPLSGSPPVLGPSPNGGVVASESV
jgi:hypothetical protein